VPYVSAIPATARLCRTHGLVIRTPVIGHVPAQQPPVADAARSSLRTFILLCGCGVHL
jgi:hypothetical protein